MEVSFEATQKQEASHTSDNIDCCFPDKLNSNQCYERSSNGRERIEQELKTSWSKLPRIAKTNPISYGNQYFKPTENRINDSAIFVLVSGDVRPGPSRLQPSPVTEGRITLGCDGEKFKPSQIPRRRSNIKETPIRPCVMPKKFMAKPPFKTQARNVQRIQVLNTLQDFYTEKRPITTSIATSRPIPTLGQIYRRTEDTNRVTDWLLERDNSYLHAPISSLVAEQDHISEASTAGDATHIDGNTDIIITKNSSEKPVSEHHEPPQSIANNWMSIHEYPTRDNESGYCSMSLGPQIPKYMNSKHSNVIPIVKQSEKKHYLAIPERKSSSQSISSNDGNSAGMLLSEQQTVLLAAKPQGSDAALLAAKVLPRHKTSKASQNSRSAFTKGMQFPSDGKFAKSYVDCPSEMIQKTTDFEIAGYASSSSIAATDLEYREYSSRGTLENIDGNSMVWEDAHQWSSTGTKSLNSFCCDLGEDQITLMHQTDELSTKCNSGLISTGTFRHYSNCCMVRRDRCKRLHGRSVFRKHSHYIEKLVSSSSNKFKERRPSDIPRKRLSFRRMCQRRWNAVCQKTVERFVNRPKSSMRIMKIRMMYAHPELFLEDVNVQTTDAMCTDAGMSTINCENRSAGVATSLKWVSPHNHFMDAATSGTIPVTKKPLPRYGDFGPSMFPWKFSSCSKRKFTTPQNSEILSNVSKKRRQSRSITNHKPNECINTRSKSVQSVNKLLKDESSLATVIKHSTPSVSKEIQAELSGPLRQVESKTTIMISRPINVKHMRKDQTTEPDDNEYKKSIFSSINNSVVIKTDTDQKISFEEGGYETVENTPIENREPSYKNIILTGAGTMDFLHGKNEELIKSLQYSDLIYLEQPYTNNMIACNPAEVDVSFCAPSKCCQTGTSCRIHHLCDRSTSVETQSLNRPAVNKTSKGMVTIANNPQKVSIGLSGFKLNHLEKKEASTEAVSPLTHLGYQGPKIISISSGFMTSPSVDTFRRETRSAGNSAKTIMLKDIQILTSPSLQCHTSQLVSCGTDTIYDVEGHSKATSVEKIVLYSDTGTNAIEIRSKKSLIIEGSGSLEIPNFNAKHYVPASINTDTSSINHQSTSLGVSNDTSSKLSSLAVSKKSSRPVTLIDVCVQHTNPKEKPIKSYRSAAIVCSKMPSICKTEAGTSTAELNMAQDQEIDTSEEMTPSIGDYDPGTPKSGASSKLNANKWIKKCIASMEKDQITTILRQRSKSSKARTEKKGTKKASQFTLNSSEKVSSSEVTPFSGNGKNSDIPVAAMTCITCLKPQTSTPLLSTDVSEELMSKLITQERTRSLLLKPTPFSGVFNASDIVRKKELKGTPAQTALSGVQNAEIQLCGEKKSKNVFTSRYQLASPVPCQCGWSLPHSPDCKFMYGRPRCLVHRSWTDATVQMRPSQQDIELGPMSAQTTRHSVAVATESALGQTPQTTKPTVLPQLLEIMDKSAKKFFHSATVSVAHFAPVRQSRGQNTEVTEVLSQALSATTAKKSPPHDVTFSAASVPTRLTREQNTEFSKEFQSQVLDAATAKMSHHAVAVSTNPEPTLLSREQNTERAEGFLSRVLETARKKLIPCTVDASTADPAPAPVRLTREQNTDFTEEFLSHDLAAKKPAPHNVTFSTASPQPACQTREQNTDYTEEFLSKVLAATNTKKSIPHAAALSANDPEPSLQTQGQNKELAEEFLSQVPTVASAKKSANQAIAMSNGVESALHRVTRSANTKLMGEVYDYNIPPNCVDLLVCDSLAEDATQTFPGNCPPIIWFSRNQPVHFHDCNLMSSCRYYSKLLTEQITRVKENLAKHLTPSDEKLDNQETVIDSEMQAEPQMFMEACTMKPSGRNEFACQTQVRRVPNIRQIKAMSCCTLTHAFSVTDICRGHENDLKTVYFLLSAIEGRIRRMKRHL